MSASVQIAVERLGRGPPSAPTRGAGRRLTWSASESGRALRPGHPTRRGFPRSAPADRKDFEATGEVGTLAHEAHAPGRLLLRGNRCHGGEWETELGPLPPDPDRDALYMAAPDDHAVREVAEAANAFRAGEATEFHRGSFLATAGVDPDASAQDFGAVREERRSRRPAAVAPRASATQPRRDKPPRPFRRVVSGGTADGFGS